MKCEVNPRLAFLSNFFPSLTETFIYREAQALKEKGIDVRFYSLRKPDPNSLSKEALPLFGETDYLLPSSWKEVAVSHINLFMRSPYRYIRAMFMMLFPRHESFKDRIRSLMHFGEGVVLASRMKRDGISHIHAHFASQSTSVARVIYLVLGIPYSFSAHAHDIWTDRLLLPQKLRESRFVACCSDFGRRWLTADCDAATAEKVHLIYHGIDIRRFNSPGDDGVREKNLILAVGRLSPEKGFVDLIRSLAILRERGFQGKCIVIGEGPQREELERLIERLSLNGIVNLLGRVPQEKILDYYQKAWIFTLPCIDTEDGRRDGIPNVLMEAMSSRVPVVTTGNSGQPELIVNGRHGLIVEQHSPDELADAIEHLSCDRNLRTLIQDEARRRIEEVFDCRRTIMPLLGLYERALNGGHVDAHSSGWARSSIQG